jgi:hypothetical protein
MRYKQMKQDGTFSVHMDHSKSHDGRKIQEKSDAKSFVGSPHLLYSLDLSPCEIWFFGNGEQANKGAEILNNSR